MSKQNTYKLSIPEAAFFASKGLFIERLRPVFFVITSRQNYTPRI